MINIGRLRAAAAVAILCSAACAGATDEAPVTAPEPDTEAITLWTDRVELFLERPVMIAGATGEPWAIHLTDLSDFGPVTTGSVTLHFEGPDGAVHSTAAEAPARPGIYTPAPSLPAPGMYDLVLVLAGPQVEDEIFIGPIQVFGSEAEVPVLPAAESVGIRFLKEQQWPIEFATVPAGPRVVAQSIEVTGELTPVPGRMAAISAPVAGIIRWDLNRDAPTEGTWVEAGERLLRLAPVAGDGEYAALRSLAERLAREVGRLERLVAAEAVPAKRLEEARHELRVAQAQLSAMGADPADEYILSLRAPIAGTVLHRSFVPGERVEAGAPLLTVLDPRQLHLTFHVPASQQGILPDVTAATFTAEGSPAVWRTGQFISRGAALDPRRRTIPITFQTDDRAGVLKPGMLATGRLLLGAPGPELAVLSTAIVDEDGLKVVYVQLGGETFERRAVGVGGTDGEWTTIRSGVRSGERVVIRGQYQIKLSSLNTSEISDHGHPH